MALSVTLSAKQRAAIESKADLVVFGGGNGGGKTFTLQIIPLLPEYQRTPGCQSVIFAETDRKLEMAGGLVDKCKTYYAQAHPQGLDGFRAHPKKRWTFPAKDGGTSTVDLSYVGEPGQWDGLEAAVICIDQIEQVTESQAFAVFGRNRSATGVRCRKFATANPPADDLNGGSPRGHWLTKMLTSGGWIGADGFPIAELFGKIRCFTRDPSTDEFVFADTPAELEALGLLPLDKSTGKAIPPMTMTFIGALIDDHPNAEFREAYIRELAGLTMVERRRRLEGNWYVTEESGKYFQAKMFPVVDYFPSKFCRKIRSWDNAWSTAEKADWTPGVLECMEPDGALFVCDLLRLRGTFSHVERAVEAVARIDGKDVTIRLPKDAGAAGGLQSALAMRLGAMGYTVVLTQDKGDKLTRSRSYQACAERGQIRLARLHTTQGVAESLLESFEEIDKRGQTVRIAGLDRSAVSTLNGWHEGFIEEHVRFGRDTVAKRYIKKDTVDAAVGGYEFLTANSDTFPLDPREMGDTAQSLAAMDRDFADLFGQERRMDW